MSSAQRRAVVVGAGGFAGQELVRLLLVHPHLELTAAYSSTYAEQAIAEVNPQLQGWSEVRFQAFPGFDDPVFTADDVTVFFAVPHGKSLSLTPALLSLRP